MSTDNEKIYLDYLDKEMTIMGILSTFCVAALLVTINSFILPGKDCQINQYWRESPWFCSFGVAGFLGSGLSFYLQRSHLAYYYGQISLYRVRNDNDEVEDLLKRSDGWDTWNFYKSGFGFLSISFVQIALVLINSQTHSIGDIQPYIAVAIVPIFFIPFGMVVYACYRFPNAESPIKLLFDKAGRASYLNEDKQL